MTTNPAFTVIVPCWNGEATLDETLRSARAQTAADLEVIVVDDGSTDGSADLARSHAGADPRVRIVHQTNRGVGAARNAGLAQAHGRYVSFLDADDLLEPEKLARQGAVLDEAPDIGLVLCDGCVIDAASRVLWPSLVDRRRFAGHPSLLSVCLLGGPFPPVVPLLRTSLARAAGGFDEDRRSAGWADIDFWMRLAVAGIDYHLLDDRLVRYRSTASSMSADAPAMAQAAEAVFAKLCAAHPVTAAQALRAAQQRVLDLQIARDELRALAVSLLAERDATAAAALAHAPVAASQSDARRQDAETLVLALARASAGRVRPLWIWGAGAAGRRVLARLRSAGGRAARFVDSDESQAGTMCAGVPVTAPAELVRAADRPFVIVASMHAAAIVPLLASLGWRASHDYHVADVEAVLPPVAAARQVA
ncbi:MAG TPA: glycosyltransferase [Vicinamibacterales bacterium]|nr:glycosyltransferase [Vicinamibacterales bacterium]